MPQVCRERCTLHCCCMHACTTNYLCCAVLAKDKCLMPYDSLRGGIQGGGVAGREDVMEGEGIGGGDRGRGRGREGRRRRG